MISTLELVSHFGIAVSSDEAVRLMAQIPDCTLDKRPNDGSQYAVSKTAGLDLLFRDAPGETRRSSPETRVLSAVFLFADGVEGHQAFAGELPLGLAIDDTRQSLRAKRTPDQTWALGVGNVDLSHPEPSWDRWFLEGFQITAHYRDGEYVRYFNLMPGA